MGGLPVDRFDAVFLQILVAAGKLMVAEPSAAVGGEGRGMHGFQYQVLVVVDEIRLATGIAAPQQEDQMLPGVAQRLDGGIRKGIPAEARMAVGEVGTHGERGVEQQHALPGPAREVAVRWNWRSQIVVYLLEYVDERWWHQHTVGHRETQSHGLSGFMVGVLSEDDHFHLVERAQAEGIEDTLSGRITGVLLVLLPHGIDEAGKIRLVKLCTYILLPRFFYLYFHIC